MAPRRRQQTGDPTKAVALLRCSTDEQKLSPFAQRRTIEAWAADHGVEVVAEHADIGVSGSAPVEKRPGLLAAIEDVRTHGAGLLLIAKRDRLARSVLVAAVAEQLVDRAGARVVSADGLAVEDSPDGWLLKTVRDAFSQFEVLQIRARTKAALAVVKANGRRLGGVPYGWQADRRDRNQIVKVAHEQRVLRRVRRQRARGLTLRGIADDLNTRKARPRGGGRWRPEQVRRLLVYAERVAR